MIINTMELTETEWINLSGFEKFVVRELNEIKEKIKKIESVIISNSGEVRR